MKPIKTIYLAGAALPGNIGSEAILLSIIRLFQKHYDPVRFIISTFNPQRVREILDFDQVDVLAIRREGALFNPHDFRMADIYVVCGDVALSEDVISFLPLFWSLKTAIARLFGLKVIHFGIEAGKIDRIYNKAAVRGVAGRVARALILRNDASRENLIRMGLPKGKLYVGCEPTLTLAEEELVDFDPVQLFHADRKIVVGLGIRDFSPHPFRFNPAKRRLEPRRTMARGPGPDMRRMIRFTARLTDHLAERHDAGLIFIPHHYQAVDEKVMHLDREIAEMIMAEQKYPERSVVLDDAMHPYRVIQWYKHLDLAISMRHHTNSFAFIHGVPCLCYAISEKLINFQHQHNLKEFLIDPRPDNLDEARCLVDRMLSEKAAIRDRIRQSRTQALMDMDDALGRVFRK